ncbi:MAG: RNA polymerase sigma factor [Saprospiraceae bacterium]|nr:RNA polymerase sigma factor [Saprospiraceae bacterium]
MAVSDDAIIALLQDETHKRKGFELLLDKYKERLYWHVRRMVHSHEDTDDLLQEIFVKVWRNLGKFRGDSKLYTWLYRIATNESITFINRNKRMTVVGMEQGDMNIEETLEADPFFEGNAIQLKLKSAIERLPEKQRLVFNMRYYDEMKYDEMSEVLDTSVGALKASYHHAVKKIEEYLKAG